MNRLTKREENRAYFPECFKEPCCGTGCQKDICEFMDRVCEKLARLEDLEESGRLIILPCAIGDIVYRINKGAKSPIRPLRVVSFKIKGFTKGFMEMKCHDEYGGEFKYRATVWGTKVFFELSEAKRALEQMEGGRRDEVD